MVRPLPFPGQPLGQAAAFRLIAREIAENLAKLARGRVRRDAKRVQSEYDLGEWRRKWTGKPWLKCQSLRDYVVPRQGPELVARIGDRLIKAPRSAYYDFRLAALGAIVKNWAGDAREIVEVGSGCGLNVFSLHLVGQWERLVGLEISETAVRAACATRDHFELSGITFDCLDATDPSHPGWAQVRGRVVLTYYCLEQLKYFTPVVLDNLLAAGAKRVIHVEPTTERLRWWKLLDVNSYLYMRHKDYLDNLVSNVRAFQAAGRLRVLAVERLLYAPSPRNDPTLVCWEPA